MNFKVKVAGMFENVRREIKTKEREKEQLPNQSAQQTISTTVPTIPTIDSTIPKEENLQDFKERV